MAALSGLFYGPPAGEVDGENEHIRSGVRGFLRHILGQWWLLASAVTGCGESVPVGGDRCPVECASGNTDVPDESVLQD